MFFFLLQTICCFFHWFAVCFVITAAHSILVRHLWLLFGLFIWFLLVLFFFFLLLSLSLFIRPFFCAHTQFMHSRTFSIKFFFFPSFLLSHSLSPFPFLFCFIFRFCLSVRSLWHNLHTCIFMCGASCERVWREQKMNSNKTKMYQWFFFSGHCVWFVSFVGFIFYRLSCVFVCVFVVQKKMPKIQLMFFFSAIVTFFTVIFFKNFSLIWLT